MIDHETHLKQIIESQKTLLSEVQELNNIISIKKEQIFKMQGIIEYLNANGISLEENQKVELPEENK